MKLPSLQSQDNQGYRLDIETTIEGKDVGIKTIPHEALFVRGEFVIIKHLQEGDEVVVTLYDVEAWDSNRIDYQVEIPLSEEVVTKVIEDRLVPRLQNLKHSPLIQIEPVECAGFRMLGNRSKHH